MTRTGRTRNVHLLVDEDLHIHTPIGTIVVSCDTYYGDPRVDMSGHLAINATTIRSKHFASITLGRRKGKYLSCWTKDDSKSRIERLSQIKKWDVRRSA